MSSEPSTARRGRARPPPRRGSASGRRPVAGSASVEAAVPSTHVEEPHRALGERRARRAAPGRREAAAAAAPATTSGRASRTLVTPHARSSSTLSSDGNARTPGPRACTRRDRGCTLPATIGPPVAGLPQHALDGADAAPRVEGQLEQAAVRLRAAAAARSSRAAPAPAMLRVSARARSTKPSASTSAASAGASAAGRAGRRSSSDSVAATTAAQPAGSRKRLSSRSSRSGGKSEDSGPNRPCSSGACSTLIAIGLPRLSRNRTSAASHAALASARRRDAASRHGPQAEPHAPGGERGPQQRVRAGAREAAAASRSPTRQATSASSSDASTRFEARNQAPACVRRGARRARRTRATQRQQPRRSPGAARTPRRGRRRPSSPSGSSGHPSWPYSGGLIARSARNAWPQGFCAAKAAARVGGHVLAIPQVRPQHEQARAPPPPRAPPPSAGPRERATGSRAQRHEQRPHEERRRHDHHASCRGSPAP